MPVVVLDEIHRYRSQELQAEEGDAVFLRFSTHMLIVLESAGRIDKSASDYNEVLNEYIQHLQ